MKMLSTRPLLLAAAPSAVLTLRGGSSKAVEQICSFSPNPFALFQSCVDAPPPAPFISATAIGILLACLAATMNATGLNLQRFAMRRGSSVLNLIGMIMSSACGLLDMASFSFAPQSLLAPFGALTLVINLLVAAPLHGDVIGGSDLLSTLLVVSGVATCLANANTDATERTYEEIVSLLYRPQFHAWLGLLLGGIGAAAARLRTGFAG